MLDDQQTIIDPEEDVTDQDSERVDTKGEDEGDEIF